MYTTTTSKNWSNQFSYLKSTSTQPQNRFSLFHADSPWRSSTTSNDDMVGNDDNDDDDFQTATTTFRRKGSNKMSWRAKVSNEGKVNEWTSVKITEKTEELKLEKFFEQGLAYSFTFRFRRQPRSNFDGIAKFRRLFTFWLWSQMSFIRNLILVPNAFQPPGQATVFF